MAQVFIRRADRALGMLEMGLLTVSVVALIAIGLLMGFAIVARQYLGFGVPDDAILVSQLMLIAITCSLGYVTAKRAHIAIDILYQRLGRRWRYACDLVGSIAGLVALLPIALWTYGDVVNAYQTGNLLYGQLQLQQWPGYLFFALGLTLLCLRLALIFVSDLLSGPSEDRSDTFVKLDIG